MTTQQDIIRVGFIGAGSICRTRHLPGLARIPNVQVVAVANRSLESGRRIASEFKIPDVLEDWRKLILRSDIDAVFVGTWPYMHREMSVATLEAGKHCFCQARMAMNLADARAMEAVARRSPKLVNMICPPPTRMPYEAFIREVISSGRLGALTAVRLTSYNSANLNRDAIHWREQVEYSGRQILAMGIFAETLHAFIGPYDSLSAQFSTPIASKAGQAVGIPQVVTITGRLANGALAVEHHSGVVADKSTEGSELIVHGLEGTLRYTFGDTLEIAARGEKLKPVNVPAAQTRDWMVEHDFIAAVREARQDKPWKVSPDFTEGLLYMRKVEAVHEAARTGQSVRPADL